MLRRLYDWTISLASSPYALWALAVVSFVESSFFPIPPDVMLIPMIIATPHRAWLIAGVCTLASVLGGAFGYWIGATLYDSVGLPVLEEVGGLLYLADNASIAALSWPALSQVGLNLVLLRNDALVEARWPVLDAVGGVLNVHRNPLLQTLDFPVLQDVGDWVSVTRNDALPMLDFEVLR